MWYKSNREEENIVMSDDRGKESEPKPITVRLPRGSYAALTALAEHERRSLSHQALFILENYLRERGYLEPIKPYNGGNGG